MTARYGAWAQSLLDRFIHDREVFVLAFAAEHRREAARAVGLYGKGRHPARLNFGNCMTYATARIAGEPLLCLGDDFAKTDLELAIAPS